MKEYEGLSDAEKQKYVAMDKAAAEVGEHKKERYSKKPIGSKKFRHCYRVTNTITKKSTPCYDLCMASEHVRTCPGRIINAREKAEEAGMSTFIIDHYSFTLIDGPDYPQMCGGPGGAHRYEAMHLTTGEMACVFGIHELIKYTGCGLSESTVNNYRLAAMSVGEDFFVCAGYHVKFYHDDEEAEMLVRTRVDVLSCFLFGSRRVQDAIRLRRHRFSLTLSSFFYARPRLWTLSIATMSRRNPKRPSAALVLTSRKLLRVSRRCK